MTNTQSNTEDRVRVNPDKLRDFASEVFIKLGVPDEDASMAADVLVYADLRGVETHGMSNNNLGRIYTKDIRIGKIKPAAELSIVRETPVTALVDGNMGLGLSIGVRAMNMAIEKARNSFIGMVAVKNSHHFGAAQYFSMMAVSHGMIGISSTNSNPVVLPTGGREPVYGTNPISVSAPSGDEPTFCLDVGTSAMVFQKLILTTRLGNSIPLGIAADDEGEPTTDPAVAVKSKKLLPLGSTPELGSHKGYGLGMVVDVLCGLLSGHGASIQMEPGPSYGSNGHFFAAIRIDAFRPLEEFQGQMDDMFQRVHGTAPAKGFDKVMVAGDLEHVREQERREQGIPLLPAVIDELKELAKDVDVPWELT